MMRRLTTALPILASLGVMSGCSNLSGISDSSTTFSCKAPTGVSCRSITGTYANMQANNIPALQNEFQVATPEGPRSAPTGVSPDGSRYAVGYNTPAPISTAAAAAPGQVKTAPSWMNAPHTGMPARTPERILRIWIAPHTNDEDVFEDQRYVYTTVARGEWLVESNKASIRSGYAVIKNLTQGIPSNDDKPTPAGQAQDAAGELKRPVFTSPTGQPGGNGAN
jgi:conjugal transfer pilus assembly protein TraV